MILFFTFWGVTRLHSYLHRSMSSSPRSTQETAVDWLGKSSTHSHMHMPRASCPASIRFWPQPRHTILRICRVHLLLGSMTRFLILCEAILQCLQIVLTVIIQTFLDQKALSRHSTPPGLHVLSSQSETDTIPQEFSRPVRSWPRTQIVYLSSTSPKKHRFLRKRR